MNPDVSRCLERRAAELEEVRSRVLAMKSRVERPDELPVWDALVLHAL